MARVETGEYQVEGADYTYTINGWLKGMNAGEHAMIFLGKNKNGEGVYLSGYKVKKAQKDTFKELKRTQFEGEGQLTNDVKVFRKK